MEVTTQVSVESQVLADAVFDDRIFPDDAQTTLSFLSWSDCRVILAENEKDTDPGGARQNSTSWELWPEPPRAETASKQVWEVEGEVVASLEVSGLTEAEQHFQTLEQYLIFSETVICFLQAKIPKGKTSSLHLLCCLAIQGTLLWSTTVKWSTFYCCSLIMSILRWWNLRRNRARDPITFP